MFGDCFCSTRFRAVLSIWAVLVAVVPVQATVFGRIARVGLPAIGIDTGYLVRAGAWTPVVVDLWVEGQGSFDGYLRIEQPDRDGDLAFDQVPVAHLTAGPDAPRQFVLYCVVDSVERRQTAVSVALLDQEGKPISIWCAAQGRLASRLQPLETPARIGPDPQVICLVSKGSLTRINELRNLPAQTVLTREVYLCRLGPNELPDQLAALEAIDTIIWEAADAQDLTPRQIDTLVQWVHQGGHLMIATAATADTIQNTAALASLLPVEITGLPVKVHLRQIFRQYSQPADGSSVDTSSSSPYGYTDKLQVVPCQPRPYSRVLLAEKAGGQQAELWEEYNGPLVVRGSCASGEVTFVACPLQELLAPSQISAGRFFLETLNLRVRAEDPSSQSQQGFWMSQRSLFPIFERVVSFTLASRAYWSLAFLFTIVYILVATFCSWGLLRHKGRTHLSWNVFTAVAVVASLLSVAAVQGIRGIGQTLHQLSMVDLAAGSSDAQASTYFALKTGRHMTLDLWLPRDLMLEDEPGASPCWLKPLPAATELSVAYADPVRYRLLPSSAEIRDLRIRATAKHFEGYWTGQLNGTVEANITLGSREYKGSYLATAIQPGSTITNRLGHDLTHCYLIHTQVDPHEGSFQGRPRGSRTVVWPLQTITAGQTLDLDQFLADPRTVTLKGLTLANTQNDWARGIYGWSPRQDFGEPPDIKTDESALVSAMLAATCLSDISLIAGHYNGYYWANGHARRADCLAGITRDYMLFIGFSNHAGPVSLCSRSGSGRYRQLDPQESLVAYRVLIPVQHR